MPLFGRSSNPKKNGESWLCLLMGIIWNTCFRMRLQSLTPYMSMIPQKPSCACPEDPEVKQILTLPPVLAHVRYVLHFTALERVCNTCGEDKKNSINWIIKA